MTSKNLFFKLIKQDFKKRIWCPILVFIAYFLFLEVILMMKMEAIQKYPKLYLYDISTYVRDYFFGSQSVIITAAVCITAFLNAISGYAYLHSKVQIDTYHSLPVSRTKLFWSKYLSGVLQFFIPFTIHVSICAGIIANKGAFNIDTFSAMLSFIGLQLIIFLLVYSASVTAVGITGNMIISILGMAVLFVYSTVIDWLTFMLFDNFFDTYINYFGIRTGAFFSGKIWRFSPLSMILKLFSRPVSVTMEEAEKIFKYDASYVWVLLGAAAVYSLAAYIICIRRPSEAAGKAIVFESAEPVIKTMIVIPTSFFMGLFFNALSQVTNSYNWFVFGVVFGFFISCIFMEIIFRMDIRGAFRHKKQFLFNAACTMLIFVVLKYDVIGYDTYVPADTQLQSCAVSIDELMPLSQTIQLSNGSFHDIYSKEYRMENMEIQGNPSVMELARKAAKEKLVFRYFDYYEGIEESPEYLETVSKQNNYRYISYGYKLLNGKTVYRQYIIDITDADTYKLLSDIFNDSQYKLGATPIFNNGWKVTFDNVRCCSNFKMADIAFTPEMQSKLIAQYHAEYMELTLDTVTNIIPIGTIDFMTRRTNDGRDWLSYSGPMFVYPQFKKTIALLKEYGFDMEEKITAEEVKDISVTRNNDASGRKYCYGDETNVPYVSISSSYGETDENQKEYTDKEQIQQILDSVVSSVFSWGISQYTDFFDNQYYIYIGTDIDDSNFAGYYFIKEQIPDFIQ